MNTDDPALELQLALAMEQEANRRLRERLAAAERDAARYRWLRDVRDYSVFCERPGDLYLKLPTELDAAIDACIEPRGNMDQQQADALQRITEFGELQAALERCDALAAQLAAAERDAARYRWLRKQDAWTTAYGGVKWSMLLRQADATKGLPFISTTYGIHLDAAIDAALERPCTCHPDDNPPVPCPKKYALTECRQAALERQP